MMFNYFRLSQQVVWPSGKMIGGSSNLNAMLYIRGNRKNYDNWAKEGAEGWSYKDVFPYFLKLEDNRDPEYVANGKIILIGNSIPLSSDVT